MRVGSVDFLQAPQPPRAGWVLLTLGIAAVATVLWLDQRWASELAAADRLEQQALAALRALRVPPPPAEPTLAQRRWEQAQVELRRPWLPALRAIESATVNPVFLLSMTIEPRTGSIKLGGEAPSFDHALAYVQMLDEGGALQPATLLSHEQSSDGGDAGAAGAAGAGKGLVTFSVATRWTGPAERP